MCHFCFPCFEDKAPFSISIHYITVFFSVSTIFRLTFVIRSFFFLFIYYSHKHKHIHNPNNQKSLPLPKKKQPRTMTFEARSTNAGLWKKLVDAMKELVNEVNMQLSPEGVYVQSMDAAHVALVAMGLNNSGFEMYHMERQTVIGVNMTNFGKILKTIDNSDSLELRHNLDENNLSVIAENKDGSRSSEFSLKLMEIDSEQMQIPDIDYKASITMSASEFAKICRDMAVFGDTITVSISREGVKFSADGDIGNGATIFKCVPQLVNGGSVNDAADAARHFGASSTTTTSTTAANGNNSQTRIKSEVKIEADASVKSEVKEEIKNEDFDDDAPLAAQLPRAGALGADDDGSKIKGGKTKDEIGVQAFMTEATELSFALRYFTTFSKGSTLADRVSIFLSTDSPCKIEYVIEPVGHLSFFLAPKVEANE